MSYVIFRPSTFYTLLLFAIPISFSFAQNESDNVASSDLSSVQSEKKLFEFDNGWWRLNENGGRETRISQCGFYSTVFILDYFERPFNPVFVSENLPVTEIGVSLDTINKLLQAYNLTTTGRKNVRFTDLKHLPNDTIALVAVPNTNDTAHYYVVVPTKKGTALIDVPFGVAIVSDIPPHEINLLEERLASQGGIVLFAQSPITKRTSATADTISISPAEHNLSEFLIDPNVQPFRPQFEIKNTSSTPVAVEIQTSCGCVASSNWKSKIIDAKEKAILEFEISPQSWVVGTKTEQILLKFPDSSSKIITITGTGHGGEGTQTMKLDVPGNYIYCAAAAILPSKMCVAYEGQNCVSSGSVPFDCGTKSVGRCMGTCGQGVPAGTCTGVNLCN